MHCSQTDLAYLAGIIDADGYIIIARSMKANGGRAKPNIYHNLKTGIAGTRTEPHDLAQSLFGGNVQCYMPKNKAHRPQYQWSLQGPSAKAFLLAILPYLRVKRRHGELGLQFQALMEHQVAAYRIEQKPPYRVTGEMRADRDRLWREIGKIQLPRKGRLVDGIEHNAFPEIGR